MMARHNKGDDPITLMSQHPNSQFETPNLARRSSLTKTTS